MKSAPVQNQLKILPVPGCCIIIALITFLFCLHAYTQDSVIYQPLDKKTQKSRMALITGINVVGYGTSLIILNNTWYKNYPKTPFHTFNDGKEWLQVDKLGHGWTSYNTGRASAAMWKWAGLPEKKATWIGGLSGTAYLTVIELLDAHSSEWGWSWGDMAANLFGSSLFISQQLGWHEQRIQYKFSFHRKDYKYPELIDRAEDLFGNGAYERMLKDYNGQTYWLSANLRSFFKRSKIPKWLDVSVGYGAEGMFGGFENIGRDENGNIIFDGRNIKRYRQWYLAPDIDFVKIKSKKKWLNTAFFILNAFKLPTPALEFSNGKFKAHAIYF